MRPKISGLILAAGRNISDISDHRRQQKMIGETPEERSYKSRDKKEKKGFHKGFHRCSLIKCVDSFRCKLFIMDNVWVFKVCKGRLKIPTRPIIHIPLEIMMP